VGYVTARALRAYDRGPMTNLTPRQQEMLAAVERLQPVGRRPLARALHVREATATQHLDVLRRAGLIRPLGMGRYSAWVLAEPRNDVAERAAVQAASVWEYARRLEVMYAR
jgi:DNA-binding transcriptional ArsR family regulator